MIYETRVPTVEAERVLLSQHDLYAVAIDGKAHLISGEVFDLLFVKKAGERALAVPAAAKRAVETKQAVAAKRGPYKKRKAKRIAKPVAKLPATNPSAKPLPTPAASTAAQSIEAKPGETPVWQRALKILQDYGPLTHAELAAHLYPSVHPVPTVLERKKGSDCTYAVESDLRNKGLIERVTENSLDKWAAKKQ